MSEERLERFISMLMLSAEMSGVHNYPEISHYVELLVESVNRQLFNQDNVSIDNKPENNLRKRFIQNFKTRYMQLMDIEYNKPISGADAKIILSTIKTIVDTGFTDDQYLEWVFEEFLVENPKFRPPSLKSICSQHFVHSFIDANREIKEDNHKKELMRKRSMDLLARARVIMRTELSQEEIEEIRDSLKKFAAAEISIVDLNKLVVKYEEKLKEVTTDVVG